MPFLYCFVFSDAELVLFEPDSHVKCNESSINYNIVFKHGHQAGRFQKEKNITDMANCIGKCCSTRDCDVAFMSREYCYMVDCKSFESCVTKHLTRPKYETMLSFVSRPSRNHATFVAGGDGEPAVEENLQENSPEMDHPLVLNTSNKKDKASNLKQYMSDKSRSRRSEVIDIILAVGASIVAVSAAVIGVITMMRRLVDRGEKSLYETIK